MQFLLSQSTLTPLRTFSCRRGLSLFMCFFAILQFFFHCKRLFPWIQAFERGKAFGEAEGLCMDVCGGFSVLFSIRCFGRLGRPAVCRQAGSSLYQKIFYTWRDKYILSSLVGALCMLLFAVAFGNMEICSTTEKRCCTWSGFDNNVCCRTIG